MGADTDPMRRVCRRVFVAGVRRNRFWGGFLLLNGGLGIDSLFYKCYYSFGMIVEKKQMARRNEIDVDQLLTNWEEVYKKGLLTFWLLLFLHERPAYAYEASAAIGELSQGTISADENSMYRALNRFESLGIVKSALKQSHLGPSRKYYSLTDTGISLLTKFIQRNILLFESPSIAERIQAIVRRGDSPA